MYIFFTSEITYAVLTSGVELTSKVPSLDVDHSLVDKTGDHPVVIVLQQLRAKDSALRHNACAMALLGAPGYLLAFRISDVIELGRAPKTEI